MTATATTPSTVAQALAAAVALGVDRLDAQLLLLHALGRPAADRAWLIAHDEDVLDAAASQRYDALCRRRADGEPIAYLIGEKEFFGLPLAVDARVLVPRPDTETLVEWALDVLRDLPAPGVLDLGTGSGAIALAIQSARPDARVEAVDRSADALEVAAGNAHRLGLPVAFRQADWLEGAVAYDLIVSNPPYVTHAETDALPAEYAHEPEMGLRAGDDGLDLVLKILRDAPLHLSQDGLLICEVGESERALVRLLPDVEFAWIEFKVGQMGIFAVECAELIRHNAQIRALADARK